MNMTAGTFELHSLSRESVAVLPNLTGHSHVQKYNKRLIVDGVLDGNGDRQRGRQQLALDGIPNRSALTTDCTHVIILVITLSVCFQPVFDFHKPHVITTVNSKSVATLVNSYLVSTLCERAVVIEARGHAHRPA